MGHSTIRVPYENELLVLAGPSQSTFVILNGVIYHTPMLEATVLLHSITAHITTQCVTENAAFSQASFSRVPTSPAFLAPWWVHTMPSGRDTEKVDPVSTLVGVALTLSFNQHPVLNDM